MRPSPMRFPPMRLPLLAALFVALGLGAARAEVPRVITGIPPVQSLVAMVMGDLGKPQVLLEHGQDPHHFQMRPSQAAALARADLVFWVGPELTPWLATAIRGAGVSAKAVALLHAPGTRRMDYASGGDGLNPHAWLDPSNADAWVKVIAADLSRADPAHAATYARNAQAARATIAAADKQAAARLTASRGTPIVVAHDALGYFARHFGLKIVASIDLGDAARPGAARLIAVRRTIRATGARCVFPEAGQDTRLAQAVLEGTGARLGGAIDPAGTMLTYGPGLYPALLQDLARTIAACAGQ